MGTNNFWPILDNLVLNNELIIDRPKGSCHPRYTTSIYPFDYGYLKGTKSGDDEGIDVWIGSLPNKTVKAIICTVDEQKQDLEIKLLVGCSKEDCQQIIAYHNKGQQIGILIERP